MTQIVQLDFTELQTAIKNCLRDAIAEIKAIPDPPELPDRISLNEACQVTGSSKSQIYKLSMMGEIPVRHFGKRLVFSRKELTAWMEGRTVANPDHEVINKLSAAAKKRLNK